MGQAAGGEAVRFTGHARRKLSLLASLGITEKDVLEVLANPDERLYDVLHDHLIAVRYDKNLVVVYDREAGGGSAE